MNKLNTSILKYYIGDNRFWFRLFGYGISAKDLLKHDLLFSERYGYTKTFHIFNWSFKIIKP